jgi:hypothetical protein
VPGLLLAIQTMCDRSVPNPRLHEYTPSEKRWCHDGKDGEELLPGHAQDVPVRSEPVPDGLRSWK